MKWIVFISLIISQNSFSKETLYFVTNDWKPYTGSNLPGLGLNTELLRAAFKAEGYTNIQVEVVPWSRVLMAVENDGKYIGGFAAYYSEERAKTFIFSDPINSSVVKLAERKKNPVRWNNLKDLKGKIIGISQDYANTKELDDLIKDKTLTADVALNDEANLKKLGAERTDVTIIDQNVFSYLMSTSSDLRKIKNKLDVGPKWLDHKLLYAIFKKNAAGQKYASIFNKGLKKINVNSLEKEYMRKIKKLTEQK